jgi:hydroxyquinol 1,2-dioxygenase
MRPAHIHFMVSAAGDRTLVTHVFLAGGAHLDDDAAFGVKESLIEPFTKQPAGVGPAGRQIDGPWWKLVFNFRLAREEAA